MGEFMRFRIELSRDDLAMEEAGDEDGLISG